MAGQIPMHGGGMSEDMHSPPPGSEGDYCNDSKRKRESNQKDLHALC